MIRIHRAFVTWSASWLAACAIATAEQPADVQLTDVTREAGLDFVETIGDLEMTNIVESAGVGCAFFDYDMDGWMDIYLVNGCWREGLSDSSLDSDDRARLAGATDHLYRNQGNGTFEDVTARAGLARPGYGMGVSAADYDADGDTDFYVTNYGPNFFYRNNGDGTFTDVARSIGVADEGFGVGAAFFDYDRDGFLDLYVGNYVEFDADYRLFYAPDGFPGPLAYEGQQDRLYRGHPDGIFSDVTDRCGIRVEPKGRAMGVAAFDYDVDGWMDVFVSNDAMENFLLRNRGDGTFENRALESGVAYGANGDATAAMGVEISDYDGDARLDVFVPDMAFCCLYRNVGMGVYEDLAARSGIAPVMGQYVGWAGVSADFNLDGRTDLYVSNGDVHHLEAQENVLFIGTEAGRFRDVSESAGVCMRTKRVSRGAAAADYDNDGDIDLLINNLNAPPTLLRNDTPRDERTWLTVSLDGLSPNRDALGARVTVRAGTRNLVRLRYTGGGYLSQHDPRLHFGLGAGDDVVHIEVVWPDGSVQQVENVKTNRRLEVHQTTGRSAMAR